MAQGFDLQNAGIKKEAIGAWIRLSDAQDEVANYNCKDNPYFYMDYEDESHLIPDDLAEELCHKCPLLKLCYDFAVANGETYGVWGGINMGKAEDKLW